MPQTGQRPRAPGLECRAAADEQCDRSTCGASLRATATVLRAEADRLDALANDVEQSATAHLITVDSCAAEFPGLTPRAFADAGRRGAFAAFRSGRKLAARREDVEAWLSGRRIQPRERRPTAIDPTVEYERLVSGGGTQ
jgi:hypothetical protein